MSGDQKPKVLIVDDSAESLHILVEALRGSCAPVVARDGRHALEMACRRPQPEVILLDVMMPDLDGYQVFRLLKERDACRDIPVLFITALQDVEQEQRGLALGAVDFIRKPINPAVVQSRTLTHVELARARRRLMEQNRQLQEAAHMRDLVERMMHHDLKGPLGAIIGVPQLLIEEGDLTDGQVELLGMVSRSGNAMLEMINRSLDIYRMEQGTYRFQPVTLDLRLLMERLVAEYRSLSKEKSCQVTIHAGEEPCLVPGETLLCRSLFSNLLKNALEATPLGCPVTVTLTSAPGQVVVRIHNFGTVPPEIREKFFGRFTTYGKQRGTGLGCYSAMLMARVQQASLTMATSEEEGTTLTVYFPDLISQQAG